MPQYNVSREGQELGSFDETQLQAGLQTGYFQATDWGWCEGMAEWKALPALLGAVVAQPAVSVAQPVVSVAQAAASAAPRAKPVSSPLSAVSRKPSGTAGLNPYAAPTAKTQGGPTGGVPYPIVAELTGTRPWVRLISILMWIACGVTLLYVVVILIIGMISAKAMSDAGSSGAGFGMMAGMMFIGGITSMLIIYPTLKLSKYASNITKLAASQSFTDLTAALAEQRRFWKFYGILTLIYVCLVLLFVLLALAGVGISSVPR